MAEAEKPVDILRSIAKRENWDIDVYEKPINIRYGNYIRRVIITIDALKNIYFISNNSGGYTKYRIYSGIFVPVDGLYNYRLLIRKKNILDKLSFRKNAQRFRTGNSRFDQQVYVETNHEMETHKLLSSGKIQMNIMDFLNSENLLHIGLNEINPEFTDELKGRSYLSVFMLLDWILDKSMIDNALQLCKQLKEKLT
jgi:hypothetical protein